MDPKTLPQPGDIWQHYKGGLYQIITIARFELGLEVAVVYRSVADGSTWIRGLNEWIDPKFCFIRLKP
jgi:hypothetical protein